MNKEYNCRPVVREKRDQKDPGQNFEIDQLQVSRKKILPSSTLSLTKPAFSLLVPWNSVYLWELVVHSFIICFNCGPTLLSCDQVSSFCLNFLDSEKLNSPEEESVDSLLMYSLSCQGILNSVIKYFSPLTSIAFTSVGQCLINLVSILHTFCFQQYLSLSLSTYFFFLQEL